MEMILIQSNNQYSIITICNYDTYQSVNIQRMTTNGAASEQANEQQEQQASSKSSKANTYNKDNKDNKVNKDNKEDGEKQKLVFPYQSEKFMFLWTELVKMPKWRKKTIFGFTTYLTNKLSEFDEDFVIELIENAITGNYQGNNI